ncbi:hypothetical protein GOP47_0026345 [Adiantum capillus-veneris]|nr:hypothetical protein GOP47_0026345 [Adiantum capillus-veneris]
MYQAVGNQSRVSKGLGIGLLDANSSITKVNNLVNLPKFGISGICRPRTRNILKDIIVNGVVGVLSYG